MIRKSVFMILLISASISIFAQEVDDQGRIIKYKETTVIDFEDVMLEGQIKKPRGSFLMDRGAKSFNSLIKLKTDFNKELIKSVDLLK